MNYPQACVSVLVFIVCVFFGVPVWWNTTKVYRSKLPQQLTSVRSRPVTLRIHAQVLYSSEQKLSVLEEKLNDELSTNNFIRSGTSEHVFHFNVSYISVGSRNQPKELCNVMSSVHLGTDFLQYKILLMKDESLSAVKRYHCHGSLHSVVLLSDLNANTAAVHVHSLMKLYTGIDGLPSQQPVEDLQHMSMPPSAGYKLVLTLAVANPSDFMPSWNIEEAIARYLNPVLKKLDFLGDIEVSSQILYFVEFKEKPKRNGSDHYYVKAKLPLLMNEIQLRLSTYTSKHAKLNFIVYVPPAKFVPLSIKDNKKDLSSRYSFHSTRWGGLQIYNPPNDAKDIRIPSDAFMKTVVVQLSELFGLSQSKHMDVLPDKHGVVSDWSVAKFLITKNSEYLRKCIGTLTSLYKLLDEIENIVISEEIRELIEKALDDYDLSVKNLAVGRVRDAVRHSKMAFESSEKAFYDASLLALLYFPDDQKYAIYIPLFLPASFPVLSSVYRSFKWWRSKSTLSPP